LDDIIFLLNIVTVLSGYRRFMSL